MRGGRSGPPATKPCPHCRSGVNRIPIAADSDFKKSLPVDLCPICDVTGHTPQSDQDLYDQAAARIAAEGKEDA